MRVLFSILCICGVALALADDQVPTRTIIDVLSSSAEFSVLVELLQHHGLIPLINQSWNSTFLAPLNSAFIGIDTSTISTDQLLYHFLNCSITSDAFSRESRLVNAYLDDGEALVLLDIKHGVNNGKADFVDLDLMASPRRGLVHSISKLLSVPESISAQLYLNDNTKLFSELVGNTDFGFSTVFVPTSSALLSWLGDGMNSTSSIDVAFEYLNSPFGDDDRETLISELTVPQILRPETLPATIQLQDGAVVTLHRNLSVSGSKFIADALSVLHVARDGWYIELDAVPAPRELVQITPRKFILGLGGYRLVRALDLYGHHDLIDESSLHSEPRVIIVPTEVTARENFNVPSVNTVADLSGLMLYQFFEGHLPKHAPEKLLNSQMLLRSQKYPQRVHFDRRPSGTQTLNWETLTSDPYELYNTTFYTTEELLATPPKLTLALGPILVSSHSLAYLEQLGLLQPPVSHSWTLLIPTRDAWEMNSLLKKYLDTNEKALARVFDNFIFNKPVYSDSNKTSVKQLAGLDTSVSWNREDRTLELSNSVLDATIQAEFEDVLFDNGVAHIVSELVIPADLEITAEDLIGAGKRSHFLDLLRAAHMGHVLDPQANFTLLVPPNKDLARHNITTDMNPEQLRALLELHLLPGNPLKDIADGVTGKTISDEDLEVHETSPSSRVFSLAPKSGSGQQVLLTDFGNTNGFVAGGSTVVYIDRHMSLQWVMPPKFHLRDGTYTVLGVLIGIVAACLLIFGVAIRISKPKLASFSDAEDARTEYQDEADEDDDVNGGQREAEPESH